ncbi:RecX family transcriptional regulator [Flavobacteriaceae bacterium]|jgi:regulatory protein|nr:RecX family transcriptional regulator [Flavobacteriaceae bacterium]MDB9712567.1 RecX family transcriptional regulator [Flavobacteriaceae bacterium]MDC1492123.1 RecX family transcriptional regulator [Flavobacteriaceae bacterium]
MSKLFKQSDIVQKLQRYCVYQDRCHKDVVNKMKLMKTPYSLYDNILVELIKDDFLNEERFAFSFIRGKFRIKKWGKIKLKNELFQRNITLALINNALDQINDEDYNKTFDELALKKFSYLNEEKSINSKKKFVSYLQYRGWENDLIFKKVNELF